MAARVARVTAFAALGLSAQAAPAAPLDNHPYAMTWLGGNSSRWDTCSEWSTSQCPLKCAEVVIADSVSIDTIEMVKEVTVNDDSVLTIDGHDAFLEIHSVVTDCCSQVSTLYTQKADMCHIAKCQPGQFGIGGTACEMCAGGTFSKDLSVDACTPCETNFWSSSGQHECTACNVQDGWVANANQTGCECAESTCEYTTTWGACDKSCGSGRITGYHTILSQPSQCAFDLSRPNTTCPFGSVGEDCNAHACPLDCEVGNWADPTPCDKDCNGGKQEFTRHITRDVSLGGKVCPALEKQGDCNEHVCKGYYFTGGAYSKCPPGMYQPNATGHPSECVSCEAGKYQPSDGQSSCIDCVRGQYQNATDATACKGCDAGHYSASAGLVTCAQCLAGTVATAGQFGCVACIAGQYAPVAAQSSCTLCDFGHYNTQSQRDGCSQCEAGKFQGKEGQANCTKCEKGTAHNATAHTAPCTHCVAGQFAASLGSTTCEYCAPNSVAMGTKTENCTKCDRVDDLRFHWTENEAGWAKPCVTHALNCKVGSKPAFGTCTKSCETGTQTRFIHPEYHAWGVAPSRGVECSSTTTLTTADASGISTAWDNSADRWTEMQNCNAHACPVDCVVSDWAWATCSKTCAGGTSLKTRTITTPAEYGGKPCPSMNETKPCNTHSCQYGKCHEKFVHCSVKKWAYGRSTTCNNGTRALNKDCHKCDTSAECSQKNLGFTLHVEHEKNFSFVRSQFHCDIDRHSAQSSDQVRECTCRCRNHPTGCFKSNFAFAHATGHGALAGNTMPARHINECSSNCANHPSCAFWEFNDITLQCVLKPDTADVTYVAALHSYAGQKPTKDGCLAEKTFNYWKNVCMPGSYLSKRRKDGSYGEVMPGNTTVRVSGIGLVEDAKKIKWQGNSWATNAPRPTSIADAREASDGEQGGCVLCPKGKYNPYMGISGCLNSPERAAGESLDSWFGRFEINDGLANMIYPSA